MQLCLYLAPFQRSWCWSKIANLNLPHVYLGPLREFRRAFGIRKLESWATVYTAFFAWFYTFSRFGTVPARDRRTVGQTTAYIALAYSVSRKNQVPDAKFVGPPYGLVACMVSHVKLPTIQTDRWTDARPLHHAFRYKWDHHNTA